jgi:hypothetical protein
MTEELARKMKTAFCRLFAVIVHAGKNSHSGHYIAYVRSLKANEWWKMDDGRVTPVPEQEVIQAEAYMLFYRVVNHPVSQQLEAKIAARKERKKRKRVLENGEEWARKKTSLPPNLLGLVQKAEEMVADGIEFTSQYFDMLSKEAAKEDAKVGSGPSANVTGKLAVDVSICLPSPYMHAYAISPFYL